VNSERLTRRDALRLCGALPFLSLTTARAAGPPLAPGSPESPERRALIDALQRDAAHLDQQFEKRVYPGKTWSMPYRLFRPSSSTAKLPLVLYLHGSGGLGDDNEKQLGLGNFFGARVWAMPALQRRFPCVVLAPQTDRGWAKYEEVKSGPARIVPGFGDGARMSLDIVEALKRELPIDPSRLYLTGQSMGGAGVWNLLAHRPNIFAAAVVCCGSETPDDVAAARRVPLWNFHGDADKTVPVDVSRRRMAALRKAGGDPLSTEYAGVDHNVWEWAYSEPALPEWLFAQRRPT